VRLEERLFRGNPFRIYPNAASLPIAVLRRSSKSLSDGEREEGETEEGERKEGGGEGGERETCNPTPSPSERGNRDVCGRHQFLFRKISLNPQRC
jgi:hypothetical protein